ncbi:hypothetical protein ACT3TB_16265 [Micrococcaceae sp. AOP34-BR2-30]
MGEEKPRKKKAVAKFKRGPFGIGRNRAKDAGSTSKENQRKKEDTVAGNGQILQSKGALLGRIGAWAFVAFLAIGSLAAILNVINPPAVAEPAVERGETLEGQQASEYARGFVGSWLRATSDDDEEVSRYLPISRGDITEEEPIEFRELSVASLETNDDGVSTVLVSAEVLTETEERDESGNPSDDTGGGDEVETAWVPTWYQVNVYHDGEGFAPIGWPAPVPVPETGTSPRLGYDFAGSDEIEETITDFVDAYILEVGDVTRLTHPESTIEPLGHSPYSSVEINDVTTNEDHREEIPADGTTTRAMVNLGLGVTQDTSRAATYAMTLEVRGGRWEVRNLDPAPMIHQEIAAEHEGESTNTVPEGNDGADESPEGDNPTETTE